MHHITEKISTHSNVDVQPETKRTIFEQAATVFDGWTDDETGTGVLRLSARGEDPEAPVWSTVYHQHRCFLDGGRRIQLRNQQRGGNTELPSCFLLDLTTGEAEYPFQHGQAVVEVIEETGLASVVYRDENGRRAAVWDMNQKRDVASLAPDEWTSDGWAHNCINFLCDGRHAIVFQHRGKPFEEHVQSRHILIAPGTEPKVIMEADGYFCSHVQGCPSDLQLYAYDRWPSPYYEIEQAIYLCSLDGSFDAPLAMTPETLRPADTWGARDHYVWTPDSRYIVSYLSTTPVTMGPDFNHYKLDWWLSATDWRTGEDWAAPYPPGRWGGHMQVTPDSRHIVCAGGPGFDKLFTVDLQGLRDGWNEHIICNYPETISTGKNDAPFPYPWVLPDGSGVIFSAGWPGPDHGVYMAQLPASLS